MKPYPKRTKLIGAFLVMLVPLSAIVISYILVYKKPLNQWSTLDDVVRGAADEKGEDLVSVFKDKLTPIFSEPSKLQINSVGIGLNLVPVGVDGDGVMETPKNFKEGGWYKRAGKPGEERNLIINAHYDDSRGVPAAFWDLKKIKEGDIVEVYDTYGRIFNYKVVELSYVDIKDPSRLEVLDDEEGKSTLTLITCGGVWLQGSGYSKRLVVKAELVDNSAS